MPQTELIDLSHLVKGETLPFESVAYESGFLLNCSIADDVTVLGNDVQLKQLVSILLDNAIRHGKGCGEVQLILKAEHGTAMLSVVNAGEEIPPDERQWLFERFYRVDNVRNGEDGHYGLGLAIAKAIVLSHGGKISVHCRDGLVEFRAQIPMKKLS